MKAAVRDKFGPPTEVVELRELDQPAPAEGEVLVRVHAAALNISDWYGVTGRPLVARPTTGMLRPRSNRLGTDYAGVVEAVGAGVTELRPGDEVFGGKNGAYAEYVVAAVDRSLTPKPANLTFEEAAAVPVAGLTALQALRDKGGQEDFTRDARYDLMIDIAGTRSWRECARVLAPDATVVVVGGPRSKRLLGPLGHVVGMRLGSLLGGRTMAFFIAKFNRQDMETLRELLESGRVRSVLDRRFAFADIADALDYQGAGHPRGKVVVDVSSV